ncbi:hypothetical protein SEVIR_5G427350v4 [Setaria viridis]
MEKMLETAEDRRRAPAVGQRGGGAVASAQQPRRPCGQTPVAALRVPASYGGIAWHLRGSAACSPGAAGARQWRLQPRYPFLLEMGLAVLVRRGAMGGGEGAMEEQFRE